MALYFVSPAFNRQRLRAKANAKLFVSAALFLLSAWTLPSSRSESLQRYFFAYLLAESALDVGLFSALLHGGFLLHCAEHKLR